MGQGQRLPMECGNMFLDSPWRPPAGPKVGKSQWLRVECGDVFFCSLWRPPGGLEVGQGPTATCNWDEETCRVAAPWRPPWRS